VVLVEKAAGWIALATRFGGSQDAGTSSVGKGQGAKMKLHAYLNYSGNCAEAFRFYEKHLGGKITTMLTHHDAPEGSPIPPEFRDAVMYARMTIGGTDLMANDVPPLRFQPIRSAYLSLTVDSSEEAERIHALLAAGGEIYMPMNETFFALRFSVLRDKFGTSWMIHHPRPMPAEK
jgi:PhnB protein